MVGRTVSHYRILQELGRGGMGVVYKAEDVRLGRTVALKFLAGQHAGNPGRRERLWQEARAASRLSSPHICTVYDIAEADEQVFIAMEFVDGETMKDRLERNRFGLDEILNLGIQIADGLQAAHSKKIIHRDIKLQNILINERNEVKIADFGVAKLVLEAMEETITQQDSETPFVAAMTRTGEISGTLPYMSPEQTRAEEIDARTDLFSFGVVLYEMATGARPFRGESAAALLHAIRHEAPQPVSRLRPELPAELGRIIDKALEKNRNRRFQTAGEMREALARIKPSDVPAKAKQTKLVAAAATAAVLLVAGWYFLSPRRNLAEPFQSLQVERITGTGGARDASISRDGKYIAYVQTEGGQQSLWLRDTSTGRAVQLAALSDAIYGDLNFGADGKYIYYIKLERLGAPSTLYRITLLGGTPQKLMEDVEATAPAPTGDRLALIRSLPNGESVLAVARLDGTGEHKLTSYRRPDVLHWVSWSPDGNSIAFALISFDPRQSVETIHVLPAQGGVERVVKSGPIQGLEGLCWAPNGQGFLLSISDATLGPNQLVYTKYPTGETRPLTRDLNSYVTVAVTQDASKIVSIASERKSSFWKADLGAPDSSARQVGLTTSTGDGHYGVAWLSDGRFVYTSRAGGQEDLWMKALDGLSTRLTAGGGSSNTDPCISGDNRYIVYASNRDGGIHIWRMDLDGSHAVQLTNSVAERTPACSADGRWVLYSVIGSGEITSWKIPIEGGQPVKIYDGYASRPQLSSNGRYVAFRYRDSKANPRRGFAVMPMGGTNPQPLPAITGVVVRWAKDGKSLYFLKPVKGVTNVWRQPVSGEPPTQVTNFSADDIDAFDISRDGKQLLCARANETSDVVLFSSADSTPQAQKKP